MLAKLEALLPHKVKATAIHLLLSLVVFAVVLYLILFHWYPGPWFAIDGGWQGVRIMIAVDLVLGPLLTFLIFNPNKTRLALGVDFTFIAIVQISALVWGIYAVHSKRPLAIVHWDDRLYSVDSEVLKKQKLGPEVLKPFGEKLPVIVFAESPTDPAKVIELTMKTITEGVAEYEQTDLYRPLTQHLDESFAKQVSLPAIREHSPEIEAKLQRLAAKHGLEKPEDFKYLRFSGRYQEATVIFTPDGKPVGSLPIELEPVDPAKVIKKKAEKSGSKKG